MRPLLRRALSTAAAAAALCLLPMPSQAQECYYAMGSYADASYSEEDGNLYAWGSGADYSYCSYCYHYDYAFDIWIKRVATGEVVASVSYYPGGSGETFAPAFAGESYEYGVVFWVACSCAGWIPVGYSNAIQVPTSPPIPSGESTISNGWDSGGIHKWVQILQPGSVNFYGRQVTEYVGGAGQDSCWFPNSMYDPWTTITGGSWPVYATNVWGADYVGWFESRINYYRQEGRAPCGMTMIQSMRIDTPTGDVEYVVNTLGASFTDTTVTSTRAGQSETHTWP